ncbi:hypothetical protein NO559_07015 [Dasania sp. GY-MA-18]|uniref:Uncharacterized protein n=1 Tax=Dasania phycosphaerae TaxID=2950436 RepID=A0A9J6RKT8_9GAMM|nr:MULTISPECIES: hypothetical protein [Dasania]MCR8922517.1 hypothetical protein [Dasania sp. GY-MA-18]MCZ0864945.1 hypothetical protein [Dasania phycosphaerae]MCZ0868673.1 hypothetical protein [Dasania phycosphaerae]
MKSSNRVIIILCSTFIMMSILFPPYSRLDVFSGFYFIFGKSASRHLEIDHVRLGVIVLCIILSTIIAVTASSMNAFQNMQIALTKFIKSPAMTKIFYASKAGLDKLLKAGSAAWMFIEKYWIWAFIIAAILKAISFGIRN